MRSTSVEGPWDSSTVIGRAERDGTSFLDWVEGIDETTYFYRIKAVRREGDPYRENSSAGGSLRSRSRRGWRSQLHGQLLRDLSTPSR